MEIFPATTEHAKAIATVEFNNGYKWSSYSLEKELELAKKLLESEKVFLAKEGKEIVGYISLRIEGKVVEIGMSVIKEYQGRGIGSKLLDYAIAFA